jgi:hypothetical protein
MAISQAIEFLRAALSGGSLPATVVRAQAKAAGVSWAAARRAKQRIGVEALRKSEGGGGAGCWFWSLPVQGAKGVGQGVQDAQFTQLNQPAQLNQFAPPAQLTQAVQPAAQPPAAITPPRQRVITVKHRPVGPDEISHADWQNLGCSTERLKLFLRQRDQQFAQLGDKVNG